MVNLYNYNIYKKNSFTKYCTIFSDHMIAFGSSQIKPNIQSSWNFKNPEREAQIRKGVWLEKILRPEASDKKSQRP